MLLFRSCMASFLLLLLELLLAFLNPLLGSNKFFLASQNFFKSLNVLAIHSDKVLVDHCVGLFGILDDGE